MLSDKDLLSTARPSGTRITFDDRWKQLTTNGNDAFDNDDHRLALDHYALAYHEARMIFSEAWNGRTELASAAAPMMVVSAGNSARCWERCGRADMGLNQLTSAARVFTLALKSTSAHRSLQEACAEHFSRLVSEIEQRRRVDEDACNKVSNESKDTVLAFWKRYSH